jgi:hypothetical protein
MRQIDGYPLWLGNARDARDVKAVLDAGIEAVVDLAMMQPPVVPTRELVYLRFPLVDGEGNPTWLLALAVHTVENLLWRGVPTLVACDAGMSRSLAVAARALCAVSPPAPPDDFLRQLAAAGPADVHPTFWEDVKRSVESVNEPQYRPRD